MNIDMKTNRIAVIGALRPPFLVLTPVCISLGWGVAYSSGAAINVLHFILVLIGALCAHISVNTFNEYFDFKSGLDLITERTPFSGGSGTLPQSPEQAPKVLLIGWLSLGLAMLIGLYFIAVIGWGLLPLGLGGLAIVFFYTTFITRHPTLCLLAPGLGFGPLMVMGTGFVLMGSYTWTTLVVSLVPFFLVNNLLLLNQFPDIDADRQVGRRHMPIILGKRGSAIIFALFVTLAFVVIPVGVFLNVFPSGGLWGMLGLLIAIPTAVGVLINAENRDRLLPWMKLNVLLNLLTPSIITAGIFFAR